MASRRGSVVFQREILSIPFLFISLPDFFSHNEGGTPPSPYQEPPCHGLPRLPRSHRGPGRGPLRKILLGGGVLLRSWITGHRTRDTLFLCLHEPSLRVIPSLFSSRRCMEGSWQVSEWTRDGNPGRGNKSMRVEENGTMVTLNLPNSGMLVYLPCSGGR